MPLCERVSLFWGRCAGIQSCLACLCRDAAFRWGPSRLQFGQQAVGSDSSDGCRSLPPTSTVAVEVEQSELPLLNEQALPEVVIPRRLRRQPSQQASQAKSPGRQVCGPPMQAPMQDCELLEQAVREAFIHDKLAEHVGEPWARLDLAGCELCPNHDYKAQLKQARTSGTCLRLAGGHQAGSTCIAGER